MLATRSTCFWCVLVFCFSTQVAGRWTPESDDEGRLKELLARREGTILSLLAEAGDAVRRVEGGEMPEDVGEELEGTESQLTEFCDKIDERVEEMVNATKAVRARVKEAGQCLGKAAKAGREEAALGVIATTKCVALGVKNATVEAARVISEAKELGKAVKELVKETARRVIECRKDKKPILCAKTVLKEAEAATGSMREEAKALAARGVQIYKNFVRTMKECASGGSAVVKQLKQRLKEDVEECLH